MSQEQAVWHLAAIVESSEDAIISKTLDGIVLTWNAGAERLYGYSAAEAKGQSMSFLLPPDRPDEEREILERVKRGERVEHFETARIRKDGRRIDVSLTISPIRDREGNITGASHIARDITDGKRFKEQLLQTAKLESLGVLAGGVAHDFNNLLVGILGNASLALETLSPNNPSRTMIRDILDASERASLLTRQLLAYAGKGRFIVEPINLSGLVREISNLVQTSIPKAAQLRLELQEDLPMIEGDAGQLHQLVMNLVINGAEAIGPDQNGTLLVTTGVQDVDDAYLKTTFSPVEIQPGKYVTLEVHDTGCGMDESTIQRIFDPFFTTKFTGRGLGLAAVQGIVRGHRGALKVYSTPGRGTTFKVLLPCTDQSQLKSPHTPGEQLLGGTATILVIDDEPIIRRTTKSMLEHYGYTVVVAESGKEGVDLFNVLTDRVSLVLLDMTMPVMNGEETLRHLKTSRPDVKVILSSGYNEVEAIQRFSGKGLVGFIQKPYSATALAEKVKMALEEPNLM
ncbi:MAG TPA: PAS domain S-box protein [Bryobacteraceae bacterium]|nr:PAS domain S-box protein [Bryobacteraceae bacterium]